jgi:hypothetical protein
LIDKVIHDLIKAKLIERMMNVMEKYISQMKKGRLNLSEHTEEHASMVLYNISACGFNIASSDGKNKFILCSHLHLTTTVHLNIAGPD